MSNLKELKKLGNRVYNVGQKIEEADKNGMTTRIPSLIQKLEDDKNNFEKLLESIKEEHNFESNKTEENE